MMMAMPSLYRSTSRSSASASPAAIRRTHSSQSVSLLALTTFIPCPAGNAVPVAHSVASTANQMPALRFANHDKRRPVIGMTLPFPTTEHLELCPAQRRGVAHAAGQVPIEALHQLSGRNITDVPK